MAVTVRQRVRLPRAVNGVKIEKKKNLSLERSTSTVLNDKIDKTDFYRKTLSI